MGHLARLVFHVSLGKSIDRELCAGFSRQIGMLRRSQHERWICEDAFTVDTSSLGYGHDERETLTCPEPMDGMRWAWPHDGVGHGMAGHVDHRRAGAGLREWYYDLL